MANHASVSDRDGAQSMVQAALDHFGRIDIVINNAGIIRDRSFAKMSLDDFELVLGCTFSDRSLSPRRLAPSHRQGYGRIVLTTSGSGWWAIRPDELQRRKDRMLGFMNNLKIEGAKANVRSTPSRPSPTRG